MKTVKAEPVVTRSSRTIKPSRAIDESPPRVKNIRSSPSRSPGRKKISPVSSPKSSGRRSPARKSPSRRSPSRKSPSRKSPKSVKKNPVGRPPKSKDTSNSTKVDEDYLVNVKSSTNGVESSYNIRSSLREKKNPSIDYEPYIMLTKSKLTMSDDYKKMLNLAQNTELPENENSFDKSDNGNISEDDSPSIFAKFETRKLFTPISEIKKPSVEFGGKWMAMIYVLSMPVLLTLYIASCNKQSCSFSSVPNTLKHIKLENLINMRSMIILLSYIGLNILAMQIPFFGKKTTLPGSKDPFVANGIFTLFAIASIATLINYMYMPIFQIINKDFLQLHVCATILGILLVITVHIKSKTVPEAQINRYANTGNFFYDLWMGRLIQTTFFNKIHCKMTLFRTSIIEVILLNVIWILTSINIGQIPTITLDSMYEIDTYRNIIQNISINPTLLLFASMQIIYAFDFLAYESSQVTTFEIMYEGIGFIMCLGYLIYPFTVSIITKRILDHNIVLPNWLLITALVIFLTGFYIYRASNSEKDIFRQNPLDPRVAHLDTIPTFHGKKLLVSGWWGFVRHPNYLGDLILHTAMGISTYNAVPIVWIIFTFVLLIHRARRDGVRCSEKYGAAWTRYCQRVPYYLVPRVF